MSLRKDEEEEDLPETNEKKMKKSVSFDFAAAAAVADDDDDENYYGSSDVFHSMHPAASAQTEEEEETPPSRRTDVVQGSENDYDDDDDDSSHRNNINHHHHHHPAHSFGMSSVSSSSMHAVASTMAATEQHHHHLQRMDMDTGQATTRTRRSNVNVVRAKHQTARRRRDKLLSDVFSSWIWAPTTNLLSVAATTPAEAAAGAVAPDVEPETDNPNDDQNANTATNSSNDNTVNCNGTHQRHKQNGPMALSSPSVLPSPSNSIFGGRSTFKHSNNTNTTNKPEPPPVKQYRIQARHTYSDFTMSSPWFWEHRNSSIVGFLAWTYRASFLAVLIKSYAIYIGMVIFFALILRLDGSYQPQCMSPPDIALGFMDAFQLSWSTMSTVGYGVVAPTPASATDRWYDKKFIVYRMPCPLDRFKVFVCVLGCFFHVGRERLRIYAYLCISMPAISLFFSHMHIHTLVKYCHSRAPVWHHIILWSSFGINVFMAMESFVGVLFSGVIAAVMIGKVARIQSVAQIRFSRPICIYSVRADGAVNLEEDSILEESDEEIVDNAKSTTLGLCPCPVLEFRLINLLSKEPGGEILNAKVTVVASILDVDEESDETLNVLGAKNKSKLTNMLDQATKKTTDATKMVGAVGNKVVKAGTKVAKGSGQALFGAGQLAKQNAGTLIQQLNRRLQWTPQHHIADDTADIIAETLGRKGFTNNEAETLEDLWLKLHNEKMFWGGLHAQKPCRTSIAVDEGNAQLAPPRTYHKLEVSQRNETKK